MKLVATVLAVVILAVGLVDLARAVPPGFTLEFDGNGEGKVVFEGAKHTGKGMHCSNCHMDVFYVSRNSQITRGDHKRKVACFTCHDGERAFAARKNCERCHAEVPLEEPAADPAAAPAVQ